jgi:hypothetical protein
VVAVNCSLRLCPWADVLYAHDRRWWAQHRREFRDFAGMRASPLASAVRLEPRVRQLRCDMNATGFVMGRPGTIAWLGNSGAQAVNLALMLGARRVVLVGFDMHLGGGEHWHGPHSTLPNPTAGKLAEWAAMLDAAAPTAGGAEIVNACPGSALRSYPKMEWREAVEWLIC